MIKTVLDPERVLVIHDFLSSEECVALIRRSEALAYAPGTVAGVINDNVRNNERVIVDDASLASDLFERAAPFLPTLLDDHSLVGFNERWRFYRYNPGQTFSPHRDGAYLGMKTCKQSELTFMIYLNEGMVGGETRFFADIDQAFRPPPSSISLCSAEGGHGTGIFAFRLARGCDCGERTKIRAPHRRHVRVMNRRFTTWVELT